MRPVKFLMILSALPILASCAQPEKVVTVTEYVDRVIEPASQKIDPVSLRDVKFHVVTEQNFEEFSKEFVEKNDQLVFVAISVNGYEKLALNVADLKKYISQQKSVIAYYEKAIAPRKNEKDK